MVCGVLASHPDVPQSTRNGSGARLAPADNGDHHFVVKGGNSSGPFWPFRMNTERPDGPGRLCCLLDSLL